MGVQDGDVLERKGLVGSCGRRRANLRGKQEQVSKGPQYNSAAPGRFPAITRGTFTVSEASVGDASET